MEADPHTARQSIEAIFDRTVCNVDTSEAGIEAAQYAARITAPEGSLTLVTVSDTSIAVRACGLSDELGPGGPRRGSASCQCSRSRGCGSHPFGRYAVDQRRPAPRRDAGRGRQPRQESCGWNRVRLGRDPTVARGAVLGADYAPDGGAGALAQFDRGRHRRVAGRHRSPRRSPYTLASASVPAFGPWSRQSGSRTTTKNSAQSWISTRVRGDPTDSVG